VWPERYADPSPLLTPWSRKSKAIPLLPLWAVRPVQSLSACTRVHFSFLLYFIFSEKFYFQELFYLTQQTNFLNFLSLNIHKLNSITGLILFPSLFSPTATLHPARSRSRAAVGGRQCEIRP